MLFLTLYLLTLITLVAFYVWPALKRSPAKRPRLSTPPRDTAHATAARRAARPESLEGVLVAQLMAGEITHGQYLKSIEGIAAGEDERRPLTVPPEIGPANT